MKQLKPFLLWIILGAVLLVEIGWWVLSIPDIDVVGNKAQAQEVKNALDTEYKHLVELDRRAKNGNPLGVFDAEKEADIQRLTNDHLITPAWKDVLEPHVRRYEQQLAEIKQHLAGRSKHLSEPIAASSDKFGWYTTYQNLTEEQLRKLYAAGALVLPSSARSGNAPNAPAPEPDFATNSSLRTIAGFFTKASENPEASEHPVLTRRFRTMERIITVLLGATASNLPNPLADPVEPPQRAPAAIAGVSWESSENQVGGDVATYASGWKLTLTLEGQLSAVVASISALEHPNGPEAPVLIVTGSEIARKPTYTAGERKDVGAEPVTARISLLILDFTGPSSTTVQEATP